MRRYSGIPIGWKILLGILCVIATIAVIFLVYTGFSALFTGSGWADTMSNTWCTIFGLTKNAEVVPEVEPIVEAII